MTWQAERDRIGERPTDDCVDRLRHVVRTYENTPAGAEVITATRNVYAPHDWTGLTHGDLRRLLEHIDSRSIPRKEHS